MCVQVCPRPYGDVWKLDADRICAKSISVALVTGEVVLQAEGAGEKPCAKKDEPQGDTLGVLHGTVSC